MKTHSRPINYLNDVQLISELHYSAELYSKIANTFLLFIFNQNKNRPFDFYEIYFGAENFMHLAGIRSTTLSATDFYEACLYSTICIEDCTPSHSKTNMNEKLSILKDMLNFQYSKCYKIGEKNLITRENDFRMATGNSSGVIGYDLRVPMRGSNEVNKDKKPFPTTLLTNPITSYCSDPKKIYFILQKRDDNQPYSHIYFEIKKGLLAEILLSFPDDIKSLINLHI